MKLLHLSLTLLLLCLPLSGLRAAVVEDLFTVELPVADQSTSLRLQTFKQAFSKVIIKVSGSNAALEDTAFQRPMRNASRYVKQFQYERKQPAEKDLEEEQLFLRVAFDQKLIESLLRNNNYPVWGKVRPSVLMVASLTIQRESQLVSEESAPDLIETIDELSTSHGLPVQFPLFDLEDRAILNDSKQTKISVDSANILAARYQSDVVLLGELIGENGEGWRGKWQSQFSGQLFKWEFKSTDKIKVLEQSIAYLARLLAKEYALGAMQENKNTVIIRVESVNSLLQFLKVSRYFATLAVVENVQAKHIDEHSAAFYLTLRNSADELQRLIGLGDILEQVDLPVVDITSKDDDIGTMEELLSFTYRLL